MTGGNKTVCVIDDDESVRTALCRLIRSSGLSTVGYGSVDEFLAAPVVGQPDCIIADVRLPRTDGLQLPEILSRVGRKIPVIFVTAQDTQDTRAEAKRVGASAYFRKPVDDQALLDAIEWATSSAA